MSRLSHAIALLMASGLLQATVAAQALPTFLPAQQFGVGDFPKSVAIGDLNGDGIPDLVTANFSSSDVSVLRGTGTGSFVGVQTIDVGYLPHSVALGDLNGDGNPDIVTANTGSDDVSVLLGTGTGSFGTPPTTFGVSVDPVSIAIGDLNGDGKPDIVTANVSSNDVSVLLGTGTGSFGVQTIFFLGAGSNPTFVAIGDLNGDGKPDLVTANSRTPTVGPDDVSVLLGTGTGSFGTPTTFGVGVDPGSIAIGDLNGDGKPDIVTANCPSIWGNPDTVSVLLGTGTGSFGTQTDFFVGVGSTPTSVAIGDLNCDGKPDLVTANFGFVAQNVSVLLGTGTGSFGTPTTFGVGGPPSSSGPNPISVAIGDLNGDGKPDLVTTNESWGKVCVLLNDCEKTSACEQPRVAIEVLDTASSSWQFAGNGVLIGDPASTTSSRWVLTAAHIPAALAGKPMRVVAGICDRTDLTGSQIAAVQTSYYDLFVPPYINDIALLELDTALVYGANVQPATLPGASSGTFAGSVGSFLGWWTAPCGGVLPTLCQSMDMTVLTNAATEAYLGGTVNDSMMGVLDFANVNVPGNGSPGSGFFIEDAGSCTLAGILSWGVNDGSGCHLATYPSICTRVSYFLEWIADTTAGTSMGTTSHTPCGCTAMTLASYGGLPKIGNVNFGLQVEDAPVPGTVMLFLRAGAPLSLPGSTFPLGTWVLPSAGSPFQFGPRSTSGGLPCGGSAQFPLPLPMSIPPGAVGLVVSAQAIVQCPAGLGLTNGWQFALMPS